MADPSLDIEYETHHQVRRLQAVLRYHLEDIALSFDRWEEPRITGPGAYIAIVAGPSLHQFADPMGNNRWPSAGPRNVLDHDPDFHGALETICFEADGAVVVSVDGMVLEQLVRFTSVDAPPGVPYAPWMGSRHMSALDISTRPDAVSTLTLSQESGRVTVFEDGSYESTVREALGGAYRAD